MALAAIYLCLVTDMATDVTVGGEHVDLSATAQEVAPTSAVMTEALGDDRGS